MLEVQLDLLNVAETADLLRLKESTIRSWILKKKLPYVKLGGRVLIRRIDADAMITANLVMPVPQIEATGAAL